MRKRMKITEKGIEGQPSPTTDELENKGQSDELEVPTQVPLAIREVLDDDKEDKDKKKKDEDAS